MSEVMKKQVDTSSEEFKEGVEAGLNSAEDTKNWHAGNKLGQELKVEGETREPVSAGFSKEAETPLFTEINPGGNEGNLQDEKDGSEE